MPTLVAPATATPAPRYSVTGFDICVPGFERLRSQDEFILVAYPSNRSGWRDAMRQWVQDLQACDRPAGFDYAAARRAIARAASSLKADVGRCRTLARRYGFDAGKADDGGEPIAAFLYIRAEA